MEGFGFWRRRKNINFRRANNRELGTCVVALMESSPSNVGIKSMEGATAVVGGCHTGKQYWRRAQRACLAGAKWNLMVGGTQGIDPWGPLGDTKS